MDYRNSIYVFLAREEEIRVSIFRFRNQIWKPQSQNSSWYQIININTSYIKLQDGLSLFNDLIPSIHLFSHEICEGLLCLVTVSYNGDILINKTTVVHVLKEIAVC